MIKQNIDKKDQLFLNVFQVNHLSRCTKFCSNFPYSKVRGYHKFFYIINFENPSPKKKKKNDKMMGIRMKEKSNFEKIQKTNQFNMKTMHSI